MDDLETYALYGETSHPCKSLRALRALRGPDSKGTLGFFCHDEYPKSAGEEG